MTERSKQEDSWQTCGEGSLRGYSDAARIAKRSQVARRMAAISLVVTCVAVVTVVFLPKNDELVLPEYGGITCAETLESMGAYLTADLGELETQKVSKHLADCPKCLKKFESEAKSMGVDFAIVAVDPQVNGRLDSQHAPILSGDQLLATKSTMLSLLR